MPEFKESRRASIRLLFNGVNVTENIAENITSFSYTDNTSDRADDLQIELEDRDGRWTTNWYPQLRVEVDDTAVSSGSKITADIIVENWNSDGTAETLPCGSFECDEIDFDGPPDTVKIKAVSVPGTSKLRTQRNTRGWEDVRLSRVGEDMASRNGMEFEFYGGHDPDYDRLDQLQTPDMAYLQQLCTDSGLSLKATGTKIVIFDQHEFESKPAAFDVVKGSSNIISYSFKNKTNGTFSKATVTYRDSKSGQTVNTTFQPDDISPDDERPELILNVRPPRLPEVPARQPATGASGRFDPSLDPTGQNFADILDTRAKDTTRRQARAALREQNKNENTAEFVLLGDIRANGGVTFNVKGFGRFDGKYIIDTAKHSTNNDGYITTINCHKVLRGY